MTQVKTLKEISNGDLFKIGEYEFIKFDEENGIVTAVSKESLFNSEFGKNNDLRKSGILKKLKNEILPEIESIIGAENVLEFETDLLSLDGSAEYGTMKSKVSLPTLDFYRRNRSVFEKYKLDGWWWLATPDSTPEYYNGNWCVCVSPSGNIIYYYFNYGNYGVRPFCILKSDIFVSCEE